VGIVLAGALNIPLATWEEGWRISYGGNLFFSSILFVMMLFVMPESPRWLVAHDLEEQARSVLGQLRYEDEVSPELWEIKNKVTEEQAEGEGTWLDLLRPENRMGYRTLLGAGLQVLQQLSGINAIMFFAPAMFSRFFSSTVALYGTLAINIVNHLSTYITFAVVDRYGRVALMVASGLGMAIAHFVVAGLASVSEKTQTIGILVIVFSCVFVVCFAFGWGPVVWTVCSEIFPMRLRGKGISVSTAANWGFATVVGKLFPIISAPNALDLFGTFIIFGVVCTFGTAVMYFLLPETANATLEEVDAIFADHKPKMVRHFWREAQRNEAPLVDKQASRVSGVVSRKLSTAV
jgi:sugar porter (SP) family MFS transporter